MKDQIDQHVRWEPLPNLLEYPLDSLDVTFSDLELVATAKYAFDPPTKGLRINFGGVEAFKVYEEFSDPWMETNEPLPMVENPELTPWVWPLQEIKNSRWIARVVGRNGGAMELDPWRHLVLITGASTLHVMTMHEPTVELLQAS